MIALSAWVIDKIVISGLFVWFIALLFGGPFLIVGLFVLGDVVTPGSDGDSTWWFIGPVLYGYFLIASIVIVSVLYVIGWVGFGVTSLAFVVPWFRGIVGVVSLVVFGLMVVSVVAERFDLDLNNK